MLISLTQAFFSSHRNSVAAHVALLEATQCDIILLADHAPAMIQQVLRARSMIVVKTPGLEFFMADNGDSGAYPYRGTFDELKEKTLVILHTSGSTGTPTAVRVAHGTLACNDAHQLIPSLGGKPTTAHYIKGKRLFLAFPLFHAAAVNFTLGYGVYCGVICVLPPPEPLTAEVVDLVHTNGNLHGTLLPPSIIIDIYQNPEYFANMTERLEFVAYVGGVLTKEIGDQISSKLRLITLMGSTETMLLPIELNDRQEDWQYLPISSFLGHQFRLDPTGLHELVVVRNERFDLFQGIFATFPHHVEYGMKDLYERHPTKPASWVHRARTDDIIPLNNAEKLNPVTMESIISAHPAVNCAIIGGSGEFQAALLIDPKVYPASDVEKERLLENIWPAVVQANLGCPAHGRIMKGFIILTNPEKAIPKAAKGTVQRAATMKLYASEFEALYAASKSRIQQPNGVPSGIFASPSIGPTTSPPTPLVKDVTGPTTTLRSAEESHAVRSSDFSHAPDNVADLEARIETILQRILPGVLLSCLAPALVEKITDVLWSTQTPVRTSLPDRKQTNAPSPGKTSSIFTLSELHHADIQSPSNKSSLDKSEQHSPSLENMLDSVRHIIFNNPYLQAVDEKVSLFECGLDSLQVPTMVDEINALLIKLRPDIDLISPQTIYEHDSVEKLLAALEGSSCNVRSLKEM